MTRRSTLWLLWAALMLPMAVLWTMVTPEADLDRLTALSGDWALALLAVAVVLTPLARLWPALRRVLWLRRAVGLAAFGASAVHVAVYVIAMQSYAPAGGLWTLIGAEALAPGILAGWLALALMLPPALASNDIAMRALTRLWKPVQRLAWPAAVLALLHTGIVHDGRMLALVVAGLAGALQLARIFPVRSTRKAL